MFSADIAVLTSINMKYILYKHKPGKIGLYVFSATTALKRLWQSFKSKKPLQQRSHQTKRRMYFGTLLHTQIFYISSWNCYLVICVSHFCLQYITLKNLCWMRDLLRLQIFSCNWFLWIWISLLVKKMYS